MSMLSLGRRWLSYAYGLHESVFSQPNLWEVSSNEASIGLMTDSSAICDQLGNR